MGLQQMRLALELRRWRAAGRQAVLWLRDDDARAPTPQLERLLALTARFGVPLTLAVIPDGRPADLAPLLADHPEATVVQHGCDHRNRRQGSAAGEFAHDQPASELTPRLQGGWSRLAGLPGAFPAYVPPWNDVHPELPAVLQQAGYAGWSAWPSAAPRGGPPRVDACLDLLRWRKGPRFRGAARMAAGLRRALESRRAAGRWDAPVGLLAHHLDHDEPAWAWLEAFLAWSSAEPGVQWRGLPALIAQEGARAERAA